MRLDVHSLSSWYGEARALTDVSLTADDGEIVGLLGRNGAGKSTLLRSLSGLHRQRSGTIELDGTDVTRWRPEQIARRGISFVREAGAMPMSMSVEDNLRLGARLGRIRGTKTIPLEEIWERFPLLRPLRKRLAGVLSGGERQTLALATAFISGPALVLLDEPSAGLSPKTAHTIFDLIRDVASSSGATIVVAEQSAALLERIVDRSYLLDVGRVVVEGVVSDLLSAAQHREASSEGGEQ